MSVRIGRQLRWAAVAMAVAATLAAVAPLVQADPPAQASAGKTVTIRNFAFQPATLQIDRGTRVTFANASKVVHTATRSGSFDTRRIEPGKSARVRFNRKGTFAYHCKIHPFMRGKIVVE